MPSLSLLPYNPNDLFWHFWLSQITKSLHVYQALRTSICALLSSTHAHVDQMNKNSKRQHLMPPKWGFILHHAAEDLKMTLPCVSVSKKGHFYRTKENLLYIQSRISVLARNFSALKQTNVPSSAFHKPLDLCECQQYYPPTPVPNPVWRPGHHARIKSQDAKPPVM